MQKWAVAHENVESYPMWGTVAARDQPEGWYTHVAPFSATARQKRAPGAQERVLRNVRAGATRENLDHCRPFQRLTVPRSMAKQRDAEVQETAGNPALRASVSGSRRRAGRR